VILWPTEVVSSILKTSDTANSPITTGKNGKPIVKISFPKSNLVYGLITSIPTVANNNPKTPEIIPFNIELPDTENIIVNPKTANAKYSAELNFNANPDINGDIIVINTTLINPPQTEATTA